MDQLPCLYFILTCLPLLLPSSHGAIPPSHAADQLALLSFKAAISDDPFRALASWNDSTHYCQWPGVTCSHRRHPDRVTALSLDSLDLAGPVSPSLSNLSFLQRLNLPYNHLHGPIPPQLSSLSRLRYLNLTLNSLSGPIPESFSHLPRIQTLNLQANSLQGTIPPNLSRCASLRILMLSNNNLTGEIPGELGSLPNLTYIDLRGNNLAGTIPPTLGNLPSLFAMDLSSNRLSGAIPSSFRRLTSLVFLYLHENSLAGAIPPLYNLSALRYINLAYNNLTGGIPSYFGNLTSLTSINLTMNAMSGPIPPSLGHLPSLELLILTGNSFSGPIPPSLGLLPSVQALGLSHNQLSGTIPSTLYNMSTIEYLGLANNQFVGALPHNLGQSFPALRSLYLYYNQFDGPLPMSLANMTALEDVEVTGNNFSGTIPPNLGNLQNLYWLSLDRNQFDARDAGGWNFLTSLTNCTQLQVLSLDINGLGGVLPNSVANLSTKLEWLALGGNQMSGSLPPEIGNLVGLTILGLDRNLLAGRIPSTLGNLQGLRELFLWGNKLTGTIPASLGNLTQLNRLYLSDNELEGSIPPSLSNCQVLRRLNLTNNKLSGAIPKEVVSLSSLSEYLGLAHNLLNGSLPLEVGQLRNLVEFDVSENRLSGNIPSTIGACELLDTLHMEGNLFEGKIPSTMSNLKGIQELDLSRNNLSGPIPDFCKNFKFLQYLNLSFNHLEGRVPTKGIFGNLSAVSVLGNDGLCGGDPKLNLPTCNSRIQEKKDGSRRLKVIIPTAIMFLFAFLSMCLFVFWYTHRRKTTQVPVTVSAAGHHIKVSYADILKATDGFSSTNLIGVGSFGSVYRGMMNLGQERWVAIKVLNLQRRGASKSFITECEALREVRHRNLIKILTSCSSVDYSGNGFKALVFEYMPSGSLEKWLHSEGEQRSLTLRQRLDIAIDIASALDYLHHHGPTQIVHCDLKPSNVLLDDDMTAHVGDFGLAKLLAETIGNSYQSSTGSIGIKGTIGYVAPEYGVANQVSTKGDVYSYGILLLEMFTGRRPTDDTLKEGLSLPGLIEMAFPEKVMDVIDPNLLFQEGDESLRVKSEDCLVSVLRIGLRCSKQSPRERMQMGDVTRELQAARDSFVATGLNGERRNKEQFKDEGPSQVAHKQ